MLASLLVGHSARARGTVCPWAIPRSEGGAWRESSKNWLSMRPACLAVRSLCRLWLTRLLSAMIVLNGTTLEIKGALDLTTKKDQAKLVKLSLVRPAVCLMRPQTPSRASQSC